MPKLDGKPAPKTNPFGVSQAMRRARSRRKKCRNCRGYGFMVLRAFKRKDGARVIELSGTMCHECGGVGDARKQIAQQG